MSAAVVLLVLTVTVVAWILVVRHRVAGLLTAESRRYRLLFPRDLDPEAVTTFVADLGGLRGPWWQQRLLRRPVILEVWADEQTVSHLLVVPQRWADRALASLRAALPGVRFESLAVDSSGERPLVAAELAISATDRPLRVDRVAEVSAGLLHRMHPLGNGESVRLQWIVAPAGLPQVVRRRSSNGRQHPQAWAPFTARPADPEAVKAVQAKQAEPLFFATSRIGVTAPSRGQACQTLGRILGAFHLLNAPGVHLRRRWLPSAIVASRIERGAIPLVSWPLLLNASELAAGLAFPVGGVQLPGLALGGCRQLAPSALIPRTGRVVADATFPGTERPLAIAPLDRLKHVHVVGPSGVGKSVLLTQLIIQDIAAGSGAVVLDPKGDLIADVLDRLPAKRLDDVVVLDPTDEGRPVGFNLLSGIDDAPELVVDQVVGTIRHIYKQFWGPRSDDILRAALLTLATEPSMTLVEVPLLLTDEGFRRRLTGRLNEPVALEPFWGWYEGLSDAERALAIGPVLNKLRGLFLLRPRIRNVVGQADSPLDLGDVLANGRVLLVNLAKGLLGEEASRLFGSLVLARLWHATLGRAGLAADRRPAVFVHVDEFQDFLHSATDLGDFLAQARGLGVGLTLAHQHLAQLSTAMRAGVLANARSRVIFQAAAADARVLARELAGYLTPADLQGLGPYEVIVQVAVGPHVAPPTTGRTRALPPPTGTATEARRRSRDRYGRDRAEVERAIHSRHGERPGGGPIGRTRRTSGGRS